eukprot:1158473-Pelagomonas_calceolata.AAC.1
MLTARVTSSSVEPAQRRSTSKRSTSQHNDQITKCSPPLGHNLVCGAYTRMRCMHANVQIVTTLQ